MSESCHNEKCENYYKDSKRVYMKCSACHLVFVCEKDLLEYKDEVKIYDLHQNNKKDLAYQNFLNKLLIPLEEFLSPNSRGLDFGCGPGPAISYLLNKKSHHVSDYDPYFYNNAELLEQHYDFVTCSEVLEHIFWPKRDFLKMLSLVKDGGHLGIMTSFLDDSIDFPTWHYKNDQTHARFYSKKTFSFLANKYLKRVQFYGNSVVIFY